MYKIVYFLVSSTRAPLIYLPHQYYPTSHNGKTAFS